LPEILRHTSHATLATSPFISLDQPLERGGYGRSNRGANIGIPTQPIMQSV